MVIALAKTINHPDQVARFIVPLQEMWTGPSERKWISFIPRRLKSLGVVYYSRYVGVCRARVGQQTPVAGLEVRRGQVHRVPVATDPDNLVHAQVLQLFQYELIVVFAGLFVLVRFYAAHVPRNSQNMLQKDSHRVRTSIHLQ